MSKSQEDRDRKAEAIVQLRRMLPPGSIVYTTLAHVSRSGMQREIGVHAVVDGEIAYLSGYVASALGMRRGKRDGVVVGGAGMDMGHHIVNTLSYALHGMGDVGDAAHEARAKGTPIQPKPGTYRAGYSLTHRWL